jgi:hypothetical protein
MARRKTCRSDRAVRVSFEISRLSERIMIDVYEVNQRRRHLFRRSVQAEFSWRRENNGGLDG